MSIPPEPIVRGMLRWLDLIPTAGIQRARTLLATSKEYADLTPTQYAEALDWIQRAGLQPSKTGLVTPERLLELIILAGAPSWLPDADILVQEGAEIPDDLLSVAQTLGIAPSSTLVCIRRAWGKVDTEIRREIGDQGEREILRYLHVRSAVEVDHVASWSDVHGFDIAVTDASTACHLEVKATTRVNRLTLHLSRNEFETMLTDSSWQLAIVILDEDRHLSRVFSVERDWVRACAPIDADLRGRWESARLDVPPTACKPGISALAHFLEDPASPLLTGLSTRV